MASLLWPVQASSRPRGPWKPRWAESIQDSINLLAPLPVADRHLQWEQADSEDAETVHISEGILGDS